MLLGIKAQIKVRGLRGFHAKLFYIQAKFCYRLQSRFLVPKGNLYIRPVDQVCGVKLDSGGERLEACYPVSVRTHRRF